MNSKRSYLDTLNAGRQRRPQTTLEQLNRSLETLEQRLGQTREEVTARPAPRQYGADPRYPATDPRAPAAEPRYPAAQPTAQQRWYEDPQPPAPRPQNPAPAFDQNYQAIARDDRPRARGLAQASVAMVGKIAGELRGMRPELRHQMTAGLRREFDALRKRYRSRRTRRTPTSPGGRQGQRSTPRSSNSNGLSARRSKRCRKRATTSVNLLRLELEQVKVALDTLAAHGG